MADIPRHTMGFAEEKHEFILQIENFLYVQQNEVLLTSQTLEIEFGKPSTIWTKWLVGFKANAERILTVYLKLIEQQGASSTVLVKGSLANSKSGKQGTWDINLCIIVEAKPIAINNEFLLKCSNHTWKYKEPLWTQWTHSYDSNGTLYLKVKLSVQNTKPVLEKSMEESIKCFSASSQALLQVNYAKMLKDTSFADLTIICCDGKELKVHKNILSARNSVFEAALRTDMSERDTGVLRIDDISEPIMKILLHYFYTGELLPEWCQQEILTEFVYAAGKYQLSEVLKFLDNVLGTDKIPVYTMQLLSLVNKLGLKKADQNVTQKIVKLANEIKSGEDLLKMFGDTSPQSRQGETDRALPDSI